MTVFDHAVVGRGADRVAARIALELARHSRLAVVFGDGGVSGPAFGLPATPAARRLARRLHGHDVNAIARGRLVLAHPNGGKLLAAVARRTAARCPCPVVLSLTAPRDELVDVLLAESCDVSVVAESDGPLAALALDELMELGIVARIAPPSQPGAALARAGWRTPSWLSALGDLALAS
jgi:hypothetical protein